RVMASGLFPGGGLAIERLLVNVAVAVAHAVAAGAGVAELDGIAGPQTQPAVSRLRLEGQASAAIGQATFLSRGIARAQGTIQVGCVRHCYWPESLEDKGNGAEPAARGPVGVAG